MSIQHTLQLGLDALGRQTGGRFTLETNGWATLRFDRATEITLGADEALGLIFMHASVCSLTEDSRARLMQEGLEMALLGLGTGGCVLGYNRAQDQLVLSVSLAAGEVDGTGFVNRFSRFLDVVQRLKTAFEALASEPGASPQSVLSQDNFLPHPLMKV
ncbi:MAG: type III secretion system chaperone [Polaromonas sp.]|nr:type III secretion system chaperone [Polaromonas sp.]